MAFPQCGGSPCPRNSREPLDSRPPNRLTLHSPHRRQRMDAGGVGLFGPRAWPPRRWLGAPPTRTTGVGCRTAGRCAGHEADELDNLTRRGSPRAEPAGPRPGPRFGFDMNRFGVPGAERTPYQRSGLPPHAGSDQPPRRGVHENSLRPARSRSDGNRGFPCHRWPRLPVGVTGEVVASHRPHQLGFSSALWCEKRNQVPGMG